MNNFTQRTTRTFQMSSGGPSGGHAQTIETRTSYGPDGQSQTRTVKTSGDPSLNINSPFGRMEISLDGVGGALGGVGGAIVDAAGGVAKKFVSPLESRYSRGWGSSTKKDHRARSGLPPMKVDGKSYAEIKAQCLREQRLFEDPDFPATNQSIFYSKSPPRPFVWKRPPEICSDPKFFSGGASRFDVKQGELGDCWLLAAIAGLCQYKDLFYRVVPQDQGFGSAQYTGMFHFQFWQYGEWADVIVDDRLPTYYDKLVFMHSVEKDEFWSPLLEKAYAKINGSYEALKGGATSEAMEDFTGGVTENYDLRQAPQNLFRIMLQAYQKNSLMGCSIDANPGQLEAELQNGLIMGHAYTVTCVTMVDIKTSRMKGKIPMVRIRNPWGNECEWKGAWSDKSPEWKFISEDERKEIGLTFSDDGEFWMSFTDFIKNFQKLEICNLGPDSEAETSAKRRWEGTKHDGAWRRRVNAGGCRNYLETFWTNPQYQISVVDPDEDDDENMGTLLIALMQKGRRKLRKEGDDMLTMGYAIYKMSDENQGNLDMRFFKYNASVGKSPNFINTREICGRHKLEPGNYCIIPSTFEPNQNGEFMLRVYSEKPAQAGEIDEETGMSDVQPKVKAQNGLNLPDKKPSSPSSSSSDNGPSPPEANNNHRSDKYPAPPRRVWDDRRPTPSHGDPRHKPVIEMREEGGKKKKFLSFKFFENFGNGLHGGRLNLPELRANFFGLFKTPKPEPEEIDESVMIPVQEEVVTAVKYNYLTGERAFIPGPRAEVTDADSRQEQDMRDAFKRVSGDDMEIDAYELQEILNAAFMKEFRFEGFSNDTCRSMVAMMDDDRSGKLGFEEFKKLWNDIRLWKTVFKLHDKDRSGNFNSYELRHAFHSNGFKVSNGTFNALVQRYSHKDGKIYFDDYIHCVVRMKTMFEIFKEMDRFKRGKAEFNLDEFIQTTMYS